MPNIFANEYQFKLMGIVDSPARFQYETAFWEYMLVALPDKAVEQELIKEKNFFHDKYEGALARENRSYIVIASFHAKEMMEDTVVRWIRNICRLQNGFVVTLNNFSGLPPHTIYLRVQESKSFSQITNALKIIDGFIQSNNCPPLVSGRPRLPIAENLLAHVYNHAITEYAARSFSASFQVRTLMLLKKETQYSQAEVVNTFSLASPDK